MENLGTEVGQKMRSAVKAKLIELGTGGSSAGYIDDELPDYVMIMVANKRSKEQMVEDLHLFLGTNTQVFVNWLHQVLEKLQEVTLPTTMMQKVKRKSNETGDIPVKKDKKDKKKEKKSKRSHKEKTPEIGTTSKFQLNLPVPSITDVFANQLIQKAKRTLEIETSENMKTKNEPIVSNSITSSVASVTTPIIPSTTDDDFDIPTITEIAECAVEQVVRRKEITELEELQKRINLAKRQLRAMGSEESEDEDFLSIKEDGEEFDDPENLDEAERVRKSTGRNPSPIVFSSEVTTTPPPPAPTTVIKQSINNSLKRTLNRTPISYIGNELINIDINENKKRSILDRLGDRPNKKNDNIISISAHRHFEKEVFIPNFRRKEKDKLDELEKVKEREKLIEKEREREKEKEREREKEKFKQQHQKLNKIMEEKRERRAINNDDLNKGKVTIRQRIGSRVIVAPPRPEYDEEIFNFPVNSIVKVKPRPIIPANKQANKNLLLRAVAEAQKSTAMIKPRKEIIPQNIRTENLRNNKRKSNIVIEIPTNSNTIKNTNLSIPENNIADDEDGEDDDLMIETPVLEILEVEDDEDRDEFGSHDTNVPETILRANPERTQFVVTLDGMFENDTTKTKTDNANIMEMDKAVIVEPIKSNKINKSNNGIELHQFSKREMRTRKSPTTVKRVHSGNTEKKIDKLNNRNPVKQLIIKGGDTSDDEKELDNLETSSLPSSPITTATAITTESSEVTTTTNTITNVSTTVKENTPRKRCKLSPIKFDLKISNNNVYTKTINEDDCSKNKDDTDQLVFTKKADCGKKYENIPPLLSAITIPLETGVKIKSKDRCKYYPICRQGDSCEFGHPTLPCKSFPNCKFGDKCLYIHPKCKFDLTCTRPDCNFTHTAVSTAAPPIASHVVPVQNYKTISANPLPAMCKFYPSCTNILCTFYHPKLCRFGKNCLNKVECNFYHHELPSKDKLKWISPINI